MLGSLGPGGYLDVASGDLCFPPETCMILNLRGRVFCSSLVILGYKCPQIFYRQVLSGEAHDLLPVQVCCILAQSVLLCLCQKQLLVPPPRQVRNLTLRVAESTISEYELAVSWSAYRRYLSIVAVCLPEPET